MLLDSCHGNRRLVSRCGRFYYSLDFHCRIFTMQCIAFLQIFKPVCFRKVRILLLLELLKLQLLLEAICQIMSLHEPQAN